MTTITVTTIIKAPLEIVFDNSRNIDIHQQSTSKSKEIAIEGITWGLINKGETVTWRGKHFGFYLKHQSIISEMKPPTYFVDQQLKGHFKSFKHQHFFEEINDQIIMKDVMTYETPYGLLGKIFDHYLLKNHLRQFLLERNAYLKLVSEKNQI